MNSIQMTLLDAILGSLAAPTMDDLCDLFPEYSAGQIGAALKALRDGGYVIRQTVDGQDHAVYLPPLT